MKRKCAVPNEAHSAQLKTWSTREAPISGKRQLSYLVTNALGDPRLLLALGGHWRASPSGPLLTHSGRSKRVALDGVPVGLLLPTNRENAGRHP